MNSDQIIFCEKWEKENFDWYGVNWWPVIKIQVCYQLSLLEINETQIGKVNKSTQKKTIPLPNKLGFEDYWKLKFIDSFKKIVDSKSTILVLTNNKDKITKSGNVVINQFTDPFIQLLDKQNVDFDVHSELPPLGSLKRLKKFHRYNTIKNFNKAINFNNQLRELANSLEEQTKGMLNIYDFLTDVIVNTQASYLVYKKIFEKSAYKKVLYYCYYNNTNMAVNRAAKECGIETIEYQHSQISSGHFAYERWRNDLMNSDGFFPSSVWAWRQSDVTLLSQSFRFLNTFNPFWGGNIFASSKVKKEKKEKKKSVLVTLQGLGLPEFIQNRIICSDDIYWYIRFHPRYPIDKKMVEALKFKNPDNLDIERANKLSLYELFEEVKYHMTCFSGSAIEAQAFGVQNIIWGEKGLLTYNKQIKEGIYYYVSNNQELEDVFEKNNQDGMSKDSPVKSEIELDNLVKEKFALNKGDS